MKYQFIENNRSAFAVEKMCRALKVATSGYYRQKKRGISKRRCQMNSWIRISGQRTKRAGGITEARE